MDLPRYHSSAGCRRYAGLSQVWRAIDDARIIMPWVTHQQRVPMAFFALKNPKQNPLCLHTNLTNISLQERKKGNEKQKKNGVCVSDVSAHSVL